MEELKLTQGELDRIVTEKLAEMTKGLYTEDELNRRVTSEVDRRVETGIQKGLETQRSKWEQEFSEKAKMSAEELAKKEVEEQLKNLSAKEKEIQRKSNQLEALDLMAQAGVPKSHYEKMLGVLITDDLEGTKSNVKNFIDVYNGTKQEVETKVKSELGHIKNPKQGDSSVVVDRESFNKMGYSEKLKLKTENPELYKKFME